MLELNKPYNRTEFLNFLERSFLPDDFVLVEENLTIEDFKTGFCNKATKLGFSKLLALDVYEITHTSTHDARVGISKDAFQILLRKSYNNRALVLFVPEGSKQYRFSLIQIEAEVNDQTARIKRSYSNPRRYSFLLGENAHVKTPEQYLLQKGKLKPKDGDYFKDLQERFSVEVLTKEFYRELSNWFFWAVKKVTFPNDISVDTDNDKYNTENIIRLITRLIFVWFIKQKELVSPDLFNTAVLKTLLKDFDPESPTQNQYYRAILQNLFFATLNQEVGKRAFAESKSFQQNKGTYNIKNLYRYENEFQCDTRRILQLFSEVPFLNGGLFECLDDKLKEGKTFYWDGFSRISSRQANVPNELFFAKETVVDISKEYNDKKMQSVRVSGIIEILNKYNFTVEENTPVEIEVALDPELLGKVFENLLGAYNPETQETARKQTGSFYTPREIVNYMVNESLIAYYQTRVPEVSEENLRALFSYEDKQFVIPEAKQEALIEATYGCKILDPACGSGAFPMGILQQMVHVLGKLDPSNSYWSKLVLDKSMQEFDEAEKETDEDKLVLQEEIYNTFETHIRFPDYTRKLYLIENCIYGVDIQSIAVQISKLRFFISLICEQKRNSNPEMNYGIRPLPNLETKFVAANTLIGIEKPEEDVQYLKEDQINHMIKRLNHLRHRQFSVTNAQKKKELRKKDEALRHEIVNEVARLYKLHADENLNRYKMQLKLAEKELEFLERAPDDIRTTTSTDLFGNEKTESFNYTEKKRRELKSQIKMLNSSIEAGSNYSRLNSVVRLAEQLTSWNPYDQNNHSEFFDPEWMFGLKPDENGGGYFDVVIGNPPYVKARDSKDKTMRFEIEKRYSTTYKMWDLYIPFIEQSLNILNDTGLLTMIIPDTIGVAEYTERIVELIESKFHLHIIVFFPNQYVFESAAVRSKIICISKNKKNKDLQTQRWIYENAAFTKMKPIEGKNKYLFEINKFELNSKNCENLGSICYVTYGLRLNSEKDDELKFQKKDLISDFKTAIHIKKYTEGKYIDKYSINKEYWLEWDTERCPNRLVRATFPELYLHEKLLLARQKKIATLSTDGHICDNTIIISMPHFALQSVVNSNTKKYYSNINENRKDLIKISTQFSIKYLLAIINSALIQNYLLYLTKGRIDVYPDDWKVIPIKKTPKLVQTRFEEIVDKIMSLKITTNNTSSTSYFERQIDELVYKLYELTYEEVQVVEEGKFWLSEKEYGRIEL